MLFIVGKLIVNKYICSSINQQLIAGGFSHEGLRQLPDSQMAEISCNQFLIDTVTYLLTINLTTYVE